MSPFSSGAGLSIAANPEGADCGAVEEGRAEASGGSCTPLTGAGAGVSSFEAGGMYSRTRRGSGVSAGIAESGPPAVLGGSGDDCGTPDAPPVGGVPFLCARFDRKGRS